MDRLDSKLSKEGTLPVRKLRDYRTPMAIRRLCCTAEIHQFLKKSIIVVMATYPSRKRICDHRGYRGETRQDTDENADFSEWGPTNAKRTDRAEVSGIGQSLKLSPVISDSDWLTI